MSLKDDALLIAVKHHDGQYRKGSNDSYIVHPIRVAQIVEEQNTNEDASVIELMVITAYLHDVIEDTECTLKHLKESNIPEEAIKAINLLTKKDNQSYEYYIKLIKANHIAKCVKIADLTDNMSDMPKSMRHKLKTYKWALNQLKEEN